VTHCQSCHGADASEGQGPPLVAFDVGLSEFTTLVRQGVGLMPPFPRSMIEDKEIAQLQAYRSSLNSRDATAACRSDWVSSSRRASWPLTARER
jgi:mono/diheme cytochrome c family protein